MFKRKKKEVYVKPIKPEPRVVKEWDNHRLVQTWSEEYELVSVNGQSPRIIGYKSFLILEKKDKNAMSEPFWVMDCYDPGPTIPGYYSTYDPRDKRLMFQLFRETFLNGK